MTDPALAAGYYVPLSPRRQIDVAIRTQGDPLAFVGVVRGAIVSADPTVTLTRVQPLSEVAAEDAFFFGIYGGALLLLGGAALMLSLAGMYTITSLAVAQRTREIGIRTALGASVG